MSTFITRLEIGGTGPRLAVKDLIDMEGVPTTAGCRAVADEAKPAERDAACMAGARAAGVPIVGKANLHELAFGASGVNRVFGTPVNPLDPSRVPGGSSSGSAVAVATGEADIAYGSDTGGSVRIPSACCGTTGLKTSHGRVSLDGVWPLATSLDTIGPMARDVAGVVTAMQLLEPGFTPSEITARTVARVLVPGVDPAIDTAVDRVLAAAGFDVQPLRLAGWDQAFAMGGVILLAEAWAADHHLLERAGHVGDDVATRLRAGEHVTSEQVEQARAVQVAWRAELADVFTRVELLAMPTLVQFPPTFEESDDVHLATLTMAWNVAGVPVLTLPVPAGGPLPASLQLVGPAGSEEALVTTGAVLEAAALAAS